MRFAPNHWINACFNTLLRKKVNPLQHFPIKTSIWVVSGAKRRPPRNSLLLMYRSKYLGKSSIVFFFSRRRHAPPAPSSLSLRACPPKKCWLRMPLYALKCEQKNVTKNKWWKIYSNLKNVTELNERIRFFATDHWIENYWFYNVFAERINSLLIRTYSCQYTWGGWAIRFTYKHRIRFR